MAEDVAKISEEVRRAPEEFVAEDVPENHVVSEDVGMLTGVMERKRIRCPLTRAASGANSFRALVQKSHLP